MGVVIELRDEFLPSKIPCISGEKISGNHIRHSDISLFRMLYGYEQFKSELKSILDQEGTVEPSLYILMDLIKNENHRAEDETRLLFWPGDNINFHSESRYSTQSKIEIIPMYETNYMIITYRENDSGTHILENMKSISALICKNISTKNEIIKLIEGKFFTERKKDEYWIIQFN